MSTPLLPLAVWQSGTNENSIPANDNALRLEILNGLVISDAVTAQPGSPARGDIYIIPAGATGAQWATFDPDDLAIYDGGTWHAYAPVEGNVFNLDGALVAWAASAGYVSVGGGGGGGSPGGPTGAVQYNTGSAFGGEAPFSYDAATNTLTVDNATLAGLLLTAASATGGAGLRLPHGAAPTSPTNGDLWTTTAGLFVRINGATVGPLSTGGGGGGLTNWTEALSTSSPNASVPVVSLAATNAATNVDAAILPKGNGSFALAIADSTATGGNKRGAYAVDLQTDRGSATEVAAADHSFMVGAQNTINSTSSYAVTMGLANTINGGSSYSGACGIQNTIGPNAGYSWVVGSNNTATARYALIGGSNNSGAENCLLGGASMTLDASYALGSGYQGQLRGLTAGRVHAAGRFSSNGDAQERAGVLRANTTDATPTRVTSDQSSESTSNQIVLPNNSAFVVRGDVIARENATGDCKGFEFVAVVKRGPNAAATALVGSGTVTTLFADAGAASWAVSLTADTTNGALGLVATGEAAKNIKWVARVRSVEVVG